MDLPFKLHFKLSYNSSIWTLCTHLSPGTDASAEEAYTTLRPYSGDNSLTILLVRRFRHASSNYLIHLLLSMINSCWS